MTCSCGHAAGEVLGLKRVVEVALKAYRPFSQERLRTLPQRASDTVDLRWFLFDESYQCL